MKFIFIQKHPVLQAFAALSLLWLSACNSDDLRFEPQILAPIARGELGLESFPAFQEEVFTFNQNPGLPTSAIPIIVPPISGLSTAPSNFDLDNSPIQEIGFAQLTLLGNLRNPFGVPLSQGLRIIIRDRNTNAVVISHTSTAQIAPGATYEFAENITQGTLTPNLQMLIEEISTPGSNGQLVNMGDGNIRIELRVGVPRIRYVDIRPNSSGNLNTEADFDFGLGDNANVSGTLTLRLANKVSMELEVNLAFLDADDRVVGNLTTPPINMPAGTAANPTNREVTVDVAPILNAMRETQKIRITTAYRNTAPQVVRIENTNTLDFRIIGDFKTQIGN